VNLMIKLHNSALLLLLLCKLVIQLIIFAAVMYNFKSPHKRKVLKRTYCRTIRKKLSRK